MVFAWSQIVNSACERYTKKQSQIVDLLRRLGHNHINVYRVDNMYMGQSKMVLV